ncbi:MAG: cytochrome ubiquinol oxidase subunit I, partial [Chlamydiia bacterium]|nr:cytochrome ubiquinol oxidase subunit I [Chlamydiia bacterium]
RWLLWTMVFSVLFPQIAQQAGWFATEMGRQPWIVWKVLKTSAGVSSSIQPAQVAGSLWMFSFIYLLLFVLFLFLLDRKIKQGPSAGPGGEETYRDILNLKKG